MKILVVVNRIEQVKPSQSTAELAHGFFQRDHEVWMGDVGALSWGVADRPQVWGKTTLIKSDIADWLKNISTAQAQSCPLESFDLIFVRTNPGRDKDRGWAHDVLLDLLTWAEEQGVCVLNPPKMLRQASSKMYLQGFPASIRPKSIISRNHQELVQFVASQTHPCILKPLRGTGGGGVFIVRPNDLSNLNQIIEVILERDFVIAQEYIKEGEIGDARLLVLNGQPIVVDGERAVVARLRQGHDLRSNVAVGGKPAGVVFSEIMDEIVQSISSKLLADGVFLAGLDIIGDKIVEINVFSPGGVRDAGVFANRDFLSAILDAAEQMVLAHKVGS